jgi:peptidoglycan/LPS O-acetylase OafA/YrhL
LDGSDGAFVGLIRQKQLLRLDIEGLRALAVLGVVANHVSPTFLPGGFTGVDVFFVISGFLIGKHLLEDIAAGQFSFLKFYARRARRLLPALVVVLSAVWAFGWLLLSAPEFAALGKHLTAATLFANNILLSQQSGYFDTPSAAKPLLHLWSLGVEEQFYLLVPLLLWLGSRGRHASIAWVARLAAASFLLTALSGVPSFYLLDTRFWELGVGVAIGYLTLHASRVADGTAVLKPGSYREIVGWVLVLVFAAFVLLGSSNRLWARESWLPTCGLLAAVMLAILMVLASGSYRDRDKWARLSGRLQQHGTLLPNGLSVAGIALIGMSFACVTPAGWPGSQTVLPVLGTAMVILGGSQARGNTLLASGPLPFVGGISYPLYLWHWPLLVYWRMLGVPYAGADLIPVMLALILSWGTREFIEGPARFGRLFGAAVWRPGLAMLCTGLLVTGVMGLTSVASRGYPSRFSPLLTALANWTVPRADDAWRVHRCYFYPGETEEFAAECAPPRRTGVPRVLLWGDSHAAQLYPGLIELQKHYDFDLLQWNAAGCPPTLVSWSAEQTGCQERRAWILARMGAAAPDTVLMAARWDIYFLHGISRENIARAVADDIEWLRSLGVQRIVVFGPGPAWNVSLPMDLFHYMSLRHTDRVPERLGTIPRGTSELDEFLAAQAAAREVQYVSVLNWFCNPAGCRTVGKESEHRPDLLFWDQDHLTPSGARELMSAAAARILAAPQSPNAKRSDPGSGTAPSG